MGFKEELNKVFNDGFKEDLKNSQKQFLKLSRKKNLSMFQMKRR